MDFLNLDTKSWVGHAVKPFESVWGTNTTTIITQYSLIDGL